MVAGDCAPSAISAFESTFSSLVSGNTGLIPEATISPSPDLDNAANFTHAPDTSLLAKTVVLKLNGGLGTGMGLDKAKSLLKVKGDDTFLDLTAKQVIQMRQEYGQKVKFMLMNSFSTTDDTMDFFKQNYPALAEEEGLEMIQNKVPKLDATTFEVRRVVVCSRRWKKCKNTRTHTFCIPLSLYPSFFSPLPANQTRATNGALLDTVTCTLPWLDQDAWTRCSRMASNTCLFPTRITWEPRST
jgi:hypothetical protein